MNAILAMFRLMPSSLYWLIGAISLCGACELHGRHAEAKKWEEKEAYEKSVSLEATLTKEREDRRAFDSITMASRKVQDDAKVKIDRLQDRVRAGDVRLSVATSGCTESNTGVRNQQARCDILPTTAYDLIAIGADADTVVRKLNECIDKYNAINN
jgi:hypothetical protein